MPETKICDVCDMPEAFQVCCLSQVRDAYTEVESKRKLGVLNEYLINPQNRDFRKKSLHTS